MGTKNLILNNGNQPIQVTNFLGGLVNPSSRESIIGLPLGTVDGTPTGEIVVKTRSIGSPSGGVVRTPGLQIQIDSTNSPVTAGAQSVIFSFSSDFAGTVLTKTITPTNSPVLGWTANPGDTLPAIAYTVTAGTLTIATLT